MDSRGFRGLKVWRQGSSQVLTVGVPHIGMPVCGSLQAKVTGTAISPGLEVLGLLIAFADLQANGCVL